MTVYGQVAGLCDPSGPSDDQHCALTHSDQRARTLAAVEWNRVWVSPEYQRWWTRRGCAVCPMLGSCVSRRMIVHRLRSSCRIPTNRSMHVSSVAYDDDVGLTVESRLSRLNQNPQRDPGSGNVKGTREKGC